jgi:hypothetical protein
MAFRLRPVVAALLVMNFWLSAPSPVRAQTSEPAYARVADWLFDLYVGQSIQLTLFNASKSRPGADGLLAPHIPAMTRFMERHRATFIAAMQPPLHEHLPAPEIDALAKLTATPKFELDDATRTRLTNVDEQFRRDAQAVIRAMTIDIGLIINDTLAQMPR